jgi:hypothetical protein
MALLRSIQARVRMERSIRKEKNLFKRYLMWFVLLFVVST